LRTRTATCTSPRGVGSPLPSSGYLRVREPFKGERPCASLSFERAPQDSDAGLTPAERAVVVRVIAGDSNVEIARLRATSPRTFANQLAAIFRKLGASPRPELMAHGKEPEACDLSALTRRERQVVGSAVLGKSNKLSRTTSGCRRAPSRSFSRAMSKLGVPSRAGLMSTLSGMPS
jgi:DNA-binding CsgD family transcriptional regulator